MTDGEFAAGDWIERLSCALSALAEMQERYRDELDERRRRRVDTERRIGRWIGGGHASDDLWAFYWRASFAEGRYSERHYGPLRVVLASVRTVLAEHPAWAGVMDPSGEKDESRMQVVNSGGVGNVSSIIGGLMARAREVPGDGFKVASSELNAVLDPDTKCGESSEFTTSARPGHRGLLERLPPYRPDRTFTLCAPPGTTGFRFQMLPNCVPIPIHPTDHRNRNSKADYISVCCWWAVQGSNLRPPD